ncbi:MAG: hypothetical protein KF696_01765 [Planctomycetes bacterium]|nr:hypothetical protein [Planctomycetota bacterium]MCW8134703.1 hypothetical protein [Planctomycetota bacterium]
MRLLIVLAFLISCPLAAASLSVNLSGTNGPSYATQLGSTNMQVARFVAQASGGDVLCNALTVHFDNAANAAIVFSGVRVFFDADHNGIFDATEELATSQAPNGTDNFLTFTEAFTALQGQFHEVQVLVTVTANAAAYGEAFRFRIDAAASIDLDDPLTDSVTGTFPVQANTVTIRHSENRLQPGTGNPTSPRTVSFGATNVAALHFIVESLNPTPPGQLSGIQLATISASVTLPSSLDTAAVTRLALWQDDGDSAFEPGSGEVLIQARTPSDVAAWSVAGSVITVTFDAGTVPAIPTGQVRAFWISINFNSSGPQTSCEVTVSRTGVLSALGAAADFFIATPPLVSSNVISLRPKPPKPKSKEAQGEGGCSTIGAPGRFWAICVLVGCFGLIVRNRRRPDSTRKMVR